MDEQVKIPVVVESQTGKTLEVRERLTPTTITIYEDQWGDENGVSVSIVLGREKIVDDTWWEDKEGATKYADNWERWYETRMVE